MLKFPLGFSLQLWSCGWNKLDLCSRLSSLKVSDLIISVQHQIVQFVLECLFLAAHLSLFCFSHATIQKHIDEKVDSLDPCVGNS